MRKYSLLLCISCLLSFQACQNNNNSEESKLQQGLDTLHKVLVPELDTINSKPVQFEYQGDTTVNVYFVDSLYKISVQGELKTPGDKFYIIMHNTPPGMLTGEINTENKAANIRFNQIIKSDGTMDGPFGNSINYKLTGTGKYILIVSQSLMASNPYIGKFDAKLEVKLE